MNDPLVLIGNLLFILSIVCAVTSVIWLSVLRTRRARRAALWLAATAPALWLLHHVAFAALLARIQDHEGRLVFAAVLETVQGLSRESDIVWPFVVPVLVFAGLVVASNAVARLRLRHSDPGRA